MKELEAVLERLDTTIDAGRSLINEYDAVSADFGVVERKAASLEAEKIVFDFKPHAKKYSKALSKNDFDVAGVTSNRPGPAAIPGGQPCSGRNQQCL